MKYTCDKTCPAAGNSGICCRECGMVAEIADCGQVICTDDPATCGHSKLIDNPVSHPSHYTDGKIEVIDFIDDKGLNFCRGNAVKYIARAGKKDPAKEMEDLKKAAWYIDHEIKKLEIQNHAD